MGYGFGLLRPRSALVRKRTTRYSLLFSESRSSRCKEYVTLCLLFVRVVPFSSKCRTHSEVDAVWALVFLLAAIIAAIDAFPPTRRLLLPHLSRLSSHRLSSVALSRPPNARPEPRRPTLALVTLFNVMMIAISIWSVEELLHRNISGASRAEDNQWTFGQIAAMILLAGPLFTFGRVMRATFWGETIIRSGSQQVLTGEEYTRGTTGENAMKNEKEQGFSTRIGEVRIGFLS